MTARKKIATKVAEVELSHARLVVTVRAEFDLLVETDQNDSVHECINEALEQLRGYGSAEIVERRIVGTPKKKGEK